MGTNSIGWRAVRIEQKRNAPNAPWQAIESIDGGVRIFSDGREPPEEGRIGDSRAVSRRNARQMRRNRDRGRIRMRKLVSCLVKLGLLPKTPEERSVLFKTGKKSEGDPDRCNPYRLRAEALKRPLSPRELGRALQHLGLRRGYKSNRKVSSDEDGGKLRKRIAELHTRLSRQTGQTLGQYLWNAYQREKLKPSKKAKPSGIRFRGESDVFPTRALYAAEFDAIRAVQEPHHEITGADWDRLRNEHILFQRPLRSVERGYCEFFQNLRRHWKDTPIGHDFRIFQELNSLLWIDSQKEAHPLNTEQCASVLSLLMSRAKEAKFKSMRSLKGKDGKPLFPPESRFNLEKNREGLKAHGVAAKLRKKPLLLPLWEARQAGDNGRLDDIFECLHAKNDNELRQGLVKIGLDDKVAAELMNLQISTQTSSVSRRFMEEIVPVLRDKGLIYSHAVGELKGDDGKPLHHCLDRDSGRWPRLPYYGEALRGSMLGADPNADPRSQPEQHFGRISNPTVHVTLNQLCKLVNVLVDRIGAPPVEIHVELTRALKQSRKRRDEDMKRQAKEKRRNNKIKKLCASLGISEPSDLDIKRVKLWEELGEDPSKRFCVYSGRLISKEQLFGGEVEIDHILPFSRTHDNSMANLTVTPSWVNKLKGRRTPYEAFANGQYEDRNLVWAKILKRADSLPDNKSWRFKPNAMGSYIHDGGFSDSQLTDTAYISRAAQRYLRSLKGVRQVVPHRGALIALARGIWGLNGLLDKDNRKNREDHRHHAVDAAVIALTDRSVLNEANRLSSRDADFQLTVPDLDPKISAAIRARVPNIAVSYKPDHGLHGKMYAETAYGSVSPEKLDPDLQEHQWVTRKELTKLGKKLGKKEKYNTIRDRTLRDALQKHLDKAETEGLKKNKALAKFSKDYDIRRVRILVKNQVIKSIPSALFKGYAPASYVCCDVWRVPEGEVGKWKRGKFTWKGEFWSYADTADGKTPDKTEKKPHPAARFVVRLFKGDLVSYKRDGRTHLDRVAEFSTTDNKLDIRPHHLANHPKKYVSINELGKGGLRKVYVSLDGRIRNAGGGSLP